MTKNPIRKAVMAVVTVAVLMVALPGTSFAATSARERDFDAQHVATVAEDWPVGNCTAFAGSRVELYQFGSTLQVVVDMYTKTSAPTDVWDNELILRAIGGTELVHTPKLGQSSALSSPSMTKKDDWYHTRANWSTPFDPALFASLHDVRWLVKCA